jgi:hypothetical protein
MLRTSVIVRKMGGNRRRARWQLGCVAAVVCALATNGCGEAVRQGTSPAYLVMDALLAASGVTPDELGNVLASDVVTGVEQTIDGETFRVPTIFEDPGQVQLHIALKDLGAPGAPTGPTANNAITINRYRVTYRRADGRNTPGVDVPYPFDGAATATITESPVSVGFTLVRLQAKLEPPLKNLAGGGGALAISTLAEVTFYGRDQTGNDVTVSGSIGVNFADWGDPSS